MEETKNFKNIDFSDLGTKQKITYVGSRVALFVPRLLGKLATKLVINKIVKVLTGKTHEEVKEAAVDIARQAQDEEVNELYAKAEEMVQKVTQDNAVESPIAISDLAMIKGYTDTQLDLSRKAIRLKINPRRTLVAKAYIGVMKSYRERHKEQKQQDKMVKQIIQDYQQKQAELDKKSKEIQTLEAILEQLRTDYSRMNSEFHQFESANSDVITQYETQSQQENVVQQGSSKR